MLFIFFALLGLIGFFVDLYYFTGAEPAVRNLLEQGAHDLFHENSIGRIPLSYAAEKRNVDFFFVH